ncbi:MAG: response regulator transcription factor [Fusobacterium sp.]|nr:response regulator transcription factor [Fusobacterium sp.]
MKILIVQENIKDEKYLQDIFEKENFEIKIVKEFKTALEEVYYSNHDILIIDSKVKNISAFDFCEKVRRSDNKIGIICLTNNENIENKLDLLKIGVDDYILKPFNDLELILKIKNLFKRIESTEIIKKINLSFNDFLLDTLKRELKKENQVIDLSSKEFSILEYLLRNKNFVISREDIKKEVWRENHKNNTNIVDVYINKIRKKIDDEAGKILQTVRGHGYILKV